MHDGYRINNDWQSSILKDHSSGRLELFGLICGFSMLSARSSSRYGFTPVRRTSNLGFRDLVMSVFFESLFQNIEVMSTEAGVWLTF